MQIIQESAAVLQKTPSVSCSHQSAIYSKLSHSTRKLFAKPREECTIAHCTAVGDRNEASNLGLIGWLGWHFVSATDISWLLAGMPMSKPQRAAIYPRLHSAENMEEHKDPATLTLQNPKLMTWTCERSWKQIWSAGCESYRLQIAAVSSLNQSRILNANDQCWVMGKFAWAFPKWNDIPNSLTASSITWRTWRCNKRRLSIRDMHSVSIVDSDRFGMCVCDSVSERISKCYKPPAGLNSCRPSLASHRAAMWGWVSFSPVSVP